MLAGDRAASTVRVPSPARSSALGGAPRAPQHPLPLGTGEAQEGASGALEGAGNADQGGAANCWSLENAAALSS